MRGVFPGGLRRIGARLGSPMRTAAPRDPSLPDGLARLLQDGLENYARSIGVVDTTDIDWSVDQRLEGPHSTVFRVTANLDRESSLVCFVKSFRVPSHRPEMERRLRDTVARSSRLARVVDTTSPGFAPFVPEVLATDIDELAIVTVGVGGEPLGRAWHHLLTPRRRAAAREKFTSVGRTIRDFESLSLGRAEATTYLDEENVQFALDRVLLGVTNSQALRIIAAVRALQERYSAEAEESYYCHGDINHSNVLLDGARVRLIDFDLSSRPRTFDFSIFLLRLRLERPSVRSWTAKVQSWLVEGYGQPDVIRDPAFALVRLVKLSNGIAASAKRNDDRRLRRYVTALEETLYLADTGFF